MILLVGSVNMFVKRLPTSNDARSPSGLLYRGICRKSFVEFTMNLAGMFMVMIFLSCFAVVYVGAATCDTMGRSGWLRSWLLTLPVT